MSKRNREHRARKKAAAQKRRNVNQGSPREPISLPPHLRGFEGNSPSAVRARRRLAILTPFMWLAERNPYTPGMELPDGSLIIGGESPKQGYILAGHVAQVIKETQVELDVTFDEIITVITDATANGLIKIVEAKIA